jgi:hypothetical protein
MLEGKHAAQICRRLDERPKTLLLAIKSTGTVNPINGPEIHQGCLIIFIISCVLSLKINIALFVY